MYEYALSIRRGAFLVDKDSAIITLALNVSKNG